MANSSGEIVITIDNDLKKERYRQALLALLGKVEVLNCDAHLKSHIKNVYELLSLLQNKDARIK